MQDLPIHLHDEAVLVPDQLAPLHGFRGGPPTSESGVPLGLTIAISREAGARGTDIAKRAGAKLGWQVFTQDLLEYLCQEGEPRQDVLDQLPPAAGPWIEAQLQRLQREQAMSTEASLLDMARTVLSLAAHGEVVLLGRGAGCLLPPATTLHVRFVAPLEDRIAYLAQWQRLTEEEAAEQIRTRDQRRADFLLAHFHRRPSDVYQYDLILNTSLLGEERCANLIVEAARSKAAAWEPIDGAMTDSEPGKTRSFGTVR